MFSCTEFGPTEDPSSNMVKGTLTNSPSLPGTRTFISELLALMISHFKESLLRYTWQPSVLLMEIVGTFPITWAGRSTQERSVINAAVRLILILTRNHSWNVGHTHLDLHILTVDDFYNADDVVKHQAHFLTVV